MKELDLKRNEINSKGITLVALVITIVVLLILAMVSIQTLTGNNGLLTKAEKTVQSNKDSQEEEKVKLAVSAAQLAGNGTITTENLNKELSTNLNVDSITLDEMQDGWKYVTASDTIYRISTNGYVLKSNIEFDKLRSLYGKVVKNYSGYIDTNVTEWKLFYVDEENRDAFIISSNVLPIPQPTSNGIPLISKTNVEYSGSNSVANFEYGRKYNGLWLNSCKEEVTLESTKAVAYLCDPNNWEIYKTGKARYAAGGPTMEMVVASFYQKQIRQFKNNSYTEEGSSILNTDEYGYPKVIESKIESTFYNPGTPYWIASPTNNQDDGLRIIQKNNGVVGINASRYYRNWCGLRPVVCIPASAIEIYGEGNNITLNYK